MGLPFDSITYTIEQIFLAKNDELVKLRYEINSYVTFPLKNFKQKQLTIKEAEEVLSEMMDLVLKRIEGVALKYSLEIWYIIIRRFPNSAFPTNTWLYYFSLAALKWSSKEQSLSIGEIKSTKEDTKGIGLIITEELLFECYTFGYLCNILGDLVYKQRWLGKGLKISINNNLEIKYQPNDKIIESINSYDSRRPREFIFGETGSVMNSNSNNCLEILFLISFEKQIPIALPKPNITLFFNHFFVFHSIKSLKDYLNPYREAIEDLYGIEIEAIIHAFYAISQRVIHTLTLNKFVIKNERIELMTDLNKSDEYHRTRFLFDLCHKGYLRFERNKFINELSSVQQHPDCSTSKSNKELIESFFNAFEIDYENRESIDVLVINNPVILFSNFDNYTYWDFQNYYDFLRSLIVNSMSWFSSQHGDRYTLVIKKILKKEIVDLNVIFYNQLLTVNNEKFEIDLLVQFNSKIYLIEAKAYSKNRDFWLGKRKAILARNQKIENAVKQAKRSQKLLKKYFNQNQMEGISPSSRIDWLVCFPEQEFLHPLDKYGMINKTPRVCTLEELIYLIQNN